ncbi:MAG: hypothetical protein GXO89_05580 [Chlorobi bacterium]|nr:hypothetical protein [Chlorobiota bacterium]
MIPSKEIIDNALKSNEWDFGNEVLYKLCKKNFEHIEDGKIIAKVWLIGRSYAAAIERRRNKTDINDDFYISKVAPLFKNSEIDSLLMSISREKKITVENLGIILSVHYYLMQEIKRITEIEKRSFCSKYLHFHLPDLFFIFDSRVVTALSKYSSRSPKDFLYFIKSENVDYEYAKFFVKSFVLKKQIEKEYKLKLSNRQFDKILILTANNNLKDQ